MPRRRSAATMEKDQRAYALHRRGVSWRQIAAELGYRSHSSAQDAVRRAARDNAADPLDAEEQRQAFFDRFQDYRRAAQVVLTRRHYVVTQSGKLVRGPDASGGVEGNYLIDDGPVLAALDRLVKVDDTELRLRGLYPAVKHEVRNIDAVDARLLDLADQVALGDPGAAQELPSTA